jgi:hypothetical protein
MNGRVGVGVVWEYILELHWSYLRGGIGVPKGRYREGRELHRSYYRGTTELL